MPAQTVRSPWDFSDAFPILRGPEDPKNLSQRHVSASSAKSDVESTPQRQTNGLGDFSKIYEYLKNTTDHAKPLAPSPIEAKPASERHVPDPNRPPPPGPSIKDEAYASDGAVYTKKNVRFNDDTDVYEATDALDSPTSDDVLGPSSPSKKKTKREKKAALKEKKKAINAAKVAGKVEMKQAKALRLKSASDVDSEADIGKMKKSTPAKKASVHSQLPATPKIGTPQHKYNLRSTVATPSTPTPNAPSASAPIPIPSISTTGVSNKGKKKIAQASSADSSPAKSFQQSSLLGTNLLPGPITPKTKKTKNKAPMTPQPSVSLEHNNNFENMLQYSLPPTLQPSATISMSPKEAKRQVPRSFPLHSLHGQTIASKDGTAVTKNLKLAEMAVNSLLPVTQRPLVSFSVNERILRLETLAELLRSIPPGWQFPQYQEPGRTSHPASNFFYQRHGALVHPQQFYMPAHGPLVNTFFSGTPTFTIYSKEDRDLQLFFRLLHDFGEDKKALAQPVHLANHTSSPNGIHVFVDFSNIWIGFMEHLKYLPKPPGLRIPHQNLSFDSLVLFLERRRPVGKRVLAGSLPLLPAMELAKAIGYETNILDKVYKARELSEKQKRYAVVNALRRGNSAPAVPNYAGDGNLTSGIAGSGTGKCVPAAVPLLSNATGAVMGISVTPQAPALSSVQMSPEKWVEQGVDEILHLKILESIVDTDEPSTMVVATGDAAKAEYSEGFMKMIVRALNKGWKVELVAWGKSISMDYRRPDFTNMWAGRFRIIELDQYAEFLLDT
ncbi:hypothetical protein BLS_002993 [Venturia inaequalis]|uniref:NYN domain-containing protein n=1 Tax=Venturia inaequalis TaxID=5025 RepID=A0A8H3VDW0_VENIN|nr:hypothetical protein BLS_002993 [Venturia inaequalis]KAE9987695.1 hypothetical protein EG328_001928 [Venturia inaequalis]RDI79742.1 hypothetical protein Vi05172_g10297 [Venturia inaequalis]